MASKSEYVVVLFNPPEVIEGIYGTFSTLDAADFYGSASDAPRYRIVKLRPPLECLFKQRSRPSPKKQGGRHGV